MSRTHSSILFALSIGTAAVATPNRVHAEESEWGVYVCGGILFPSFTPNDPTAFDLVAGFGGAGVSYGLHDNLWIDVQTTLTAYRGKAIERIPVRGQVLEGNLFFSSTQVHPTVGFRFNFYPGMNFSPYLVARGGFIFSTFRNQILLNEEGLTFAGIDFNDTSELQWTATGGLAFEYRFYQFLVAGFEPTFTKAFGDGRNDWFVSATLKFVVLLGDW